MQGKVKTWVVAKGYGFIAPDDGGDDLFVHHSQLKDGLDRLAIGARLEFDAARQPDGRVRAVTVELVD
jgi:cold shock CspA family protein